MRGLMQEFGTEAATVGTRSIWESEAIGTPWSKASREAGERRTTLGLGPEQQAEWPAPGEARPELSTE